MKRGILFVTLGVTLAGVASANVFTANSPGVTSPPQVREAAPPAAPAPIATKASVDTRQAPVPLQAKHRAPVKLPAPDTKPPEDSGEQADANSGDAPGESAAKAAIEADGYKGVTVLRKGVNGVWHASALLGRTTVMLTVDASGTVAAD